MGKVTRVKPVKLVAGIIFKNEADFKKARRILIRRFKEVDFETNPIPFDFTDYYAPEFGGGLSRVFMSFRKLIDPQGLAQIKEITNGAEKKLSLKGRRLVNIDPGYLDLAKLVLASTKDYAHRIYLSRGIFAEVTLIFKGRSFQGRDWTYPDYKTNSYIEAFNKIRELYAQQIKNN